MVTNHTDDTMSEFFNCFSFRLLLRIKIIIAIDATRDVGKLMKTNSKTIGCPGYIIA